MPVRKVKGGYKWGTVGKPYPTKAQAEKKKPRRVISSGIKI